ncbi:hypothetical protein PIB30_037903 [Stylosanthes scabra]|uniref:RING-type E3 ubiquitin transferase n=2 Tax=Stylosanthes scabra TaxID=79078 RepID=A0ABU6QDD9_9FABA|nr:hypothetical protein [Stylosanthes scabra]
MAVVTEQDMKWKRERSKLRQQQKGDQIPRPQVPSMIQNTSCKSTISSLILSSFSNETTANKNNKSITFRGLGCTAASASSQQVSVPAVIRSSADWHHPNNSSRKNKKCSRRNTEKSTITCHHKHAASSSSFQDVWCGPGIGFSSDHASASVDCVVARKNASASSRRNLDAVERPTHREERPPPYLGRRAGTMNTGLSFLDDDQGIFATRPGSESFPAGRYFRHLPHPSSDGLAEIMILQGRLLMGGRLNSHDQFRDWRLDVDNMSYEQLLELGERIGHVNTGLKEDEMGHNIRKIKHVISNNNSKHQTDKKCSICQEEYEADDEIGRLNCEHKYHFQCIKQWLVHKNFCPVCKQEVVVRL